MTSTPAPVPSARGLFVAFEGGDGAGKTTQIAALRAHLEATGREVVVTREPGGTDLGRALRRQLLHEGYVAPRAEALLFAADRAHHVATLVRPALERGAVVLTDRYMDSSIAYQGAGRALDADDVRDLSLWAVEGLVPHLTVVLDVSPQLGRARRGGVHDRLEAEADAFHEAVRTRFISLAVADIDRYLILDAGAPREEIADAVWARVQGLL